MLSSLQQYILKACVRKGGKVPVELFVSFYGAEATEDPEGCRKAIRKSIDRLIAREFLTGYGSKTTRKLYLKEVRLTPKGRKASSELMPKQLALIPRIKK
jgi:hypothetical protein